MDERERLYIDISKGIDNDEIIVAYNKGHICNSPYSSSNVKIKIRLEAHERFKRDGLDLLYTIKLDFRASLIGFEHVLKHLNGKSYKIQNYKGEIVHPNYKKIIPGLGFWREDCVGKLIVSFDIDYPKSLSLETVERLRGILL